MKGMSDLRVVVAAGGGTAGRLERGASSNVTGIGVRNPMLLCHRNPLGSLRGVREEKSVIQNACGGRGPSLICGTGVL